MTGDGTHERSAVCAACAVVQQRTGVLCHHGERAATFLAPGAGTILMHIPYLPALLQSLLLAATVLPARMP
jgi:hypothetical protein